jgi:hypothetical protein
MLSPHLYIALATARNNELLAEARTAQLAREAREARDAHAREHRTIEIWTRARPKLSLRGRAARLSNGTARPAPCGPDVTS